MKSRLKHWQLYLHHHYTQIRHWLIVVIGIMLLVFSMVSIGKQNRLITQVRGLSEQNKNLSLQNKNLNEQTKNLGEENQAIAKQNRSYSRCIATIFAMYTHNFVPITITNLDTCTTDSQTGATNNTPTAGTSPTLDNQPSSTPNPTSPSPATSTSPPPTNPPPATPPPLNCTIDILGLHIGCP